MGKFRKFLFVSVVLAAQLSTVISTQPAHALVEWGLTEDAVSLGLTGVSPHVERTGNADRLWYPGGLAGTAVADCTDAGACTSVPVTGRLGSDFTAITLPNGTRRAYFVENSPGPSAKTINHSPVFARRISGSTLIPFSSRQPASFVNVIPSLEI